MNIFLTLIHTPAWLKASISADAPVNDLEYIHDLIDIREVVQEVADAVLDKLTNSRWYLTQEVVPFSLFSKHASMTDSSKEKIAVACQATCTTNPDETSDWESLNSCTLQETPH